MTINYFQRHWFDFYHVETFCWSRCSNLQSIIDILCKFKDKVAELKKVIHFYSCCAIFFQFLKKKVLLSNGDRSISHSSLWVSLLAGCHLFFWMGGCICVTQTDSGCGRLAQVRFCWSVIPVVLCTLTNGCPWIITLNQLPHLSHISSYARLQLRSDDEMGLENTNNICVTWGFKF